MKRSPSRYSPRRYPVVAIVIPLASWLREMPIRCPFICE